MEAVESDEDDTLYEARNFRRSEFNMADQADLISSATEEAAEL